VSNFSPIPECSIIIPYEDLHPPEAYVGAGVDGRMKEKETDMGVDWKGKLEDLKDRIDTVKTRMLGYDEIQQPEELEGGLAMVQQTVTDLWDALSDGFDLSDLGALGQAMARCVEIAQGLEGKTGEQKHAFVQDAALVVYRIWDPNLPVIWGNMERAAERALVHKAVDLVISVTLPLIKRLQKAEEPRTESDPTGSTVSSPETVPEEVDSTPTLGSGVGSSDGEGAQPYGQPEELDGDTYVTDPTEDPGRGETSKPNDK
jgi:hypothetical protein